MVHSSDGLISVRNQSLILSALSQPVEKSNYLGDWWKCVRMKSQL